MPLAPLKPVTDSLLNGRSEHLKRFELLDEIVVSLGLLSLLLNFIAFVKEFLNKKTKEKYEFAHNHILTTLQNIQL